MEDSNNIIFYGMYPMGGIDVLSPNEAEISSNICSNNVQGHVPLEVLALLGEPKVGIVKVLSPIVMLNLSSFSPSVFRGDAPNPRGDMVEPHLTFDPLVMS